MPNLKDIKIGFPRPQSYLFLGHSGSRKTTAYGDFPGPMYIFDFDGRTDPLVKHFPNREDVEFDTYGSHNMLDFKSKIQGIVNSPAKYIGGTIVFDSTTFLARNGVTHVIASRTREGKTLGGWRVSDMEDYSAETAIVVSFIDAVKILKSKGVNVVATAHLLPSEDGEPARLVTGAKSVGPMIPGSFNEVYYFYAETGMDGATSFKVRTVSSSKYMARTTYDLPPILNITNMGKDSKGLYSILSSHLIKPTGPVAAVSIK